MRKEKTEGVVEVDVTGHKKWDHSYDLSDMETLYRRGDWDNWGEMIHWLETEGERDNEFTPGETIAITEDLRELQHKGIEFTHDPRLAYELVFKHGIETGPKA